MSLAEDEIWSFCKKQASHNPFPPNKLPLPRSGIEKAPQGSVIVRAGNNKGDRGRKQVCIVRSVISSIWFSFRPPQPSRKYNSAIKKTLFLSSFSPWLFQSGDSAKQFIATLQEELGSFLLTSPIVQAMLYVQVCCNSVPLLTPMPIKEIRNDLTATSYAVVACYEITTKGALKGKGAILFCYLGYRQVHSRPNTCW